MRVLLSFAAVLLASGLAACDSKTPAAASEVQLGERFTLAPGDSAALGEVLVTFERVVEESRCPMDAMCVQAGRVVLEISAGRGGSRPRYQLQPEEAVSTSGYRLRLLVVQPYPSSAVTIRPGDYRATFVIDRE